MVIIDDFAKDFKSGRLQDFKLVADPPTRKNIINSNNDGCETNYLMCSQAAVCVM